MEELDYFLHEEGLLAGICLCALYKFGIDIYEDDWMEKLLDGKVFICPKPFNQPREKALEYLQIRLDALKSIDLNTL